MNIIGIGAGGHAKVVLDILLKQPNYSVIGMFDADENMWGRALLGVPILGCDAMLGGGAMDHEVNGFFVGVGATRTLALRRRLYEFAVGKGLAPIDVIHPASNVSKYATLGCGFTVMAAVIINAGSRLGENVLVNSGAIVEHDCIIGKHVHIATSACLCGGVEVGEETMVGAGSVIRQGVRIGRRAIIGAGAVVIRDVPDDCMVVGNPARII